MSFEFFNPATIGVSVTSLMFFGILGCLAAGRRLGRRSIARHGASAASANTGSLESAVFALLGLLIAFTFAGGLTRFDLRRAQAVDEANAIGTAYLRVDLVPAAAQPPLRESFRNYVDSRIATYRKLPDVGAARLELQRSRELQDKVWARAVSAVQMPEARREAALLLLPAVNQMLDMAATRIVATQMHPPGIIYVMLVGLALAAALLAGYQSAAERRYSWLHQIGFAAIVAFTVYVILDIEYPRLGFIRLDAIDKVLVDARAGMK